MPQVINVNIEPQQEINVQVVEQKILVDIQGAVVYTEGGAQSGNLSLINLEPSSLTPGELVCGNSGSTGCLRASSQTTPAIGFSLNTVTTNSPAAIITSQGAYLTQANWTTVTGTNLLTPNTVYFLSLVLGKLVTTPDMSTALFVQPIGVAINSTTMKYTIEEAIWL